MRNEEISTMRKSSDRNKALEPLLRFPEFHGTGEWKSKRLGEVVNLEYGSSLSESKRKEGIFPVVGSNGIVGYHNEYLVAGPAIVIGRKGSVGQVNWIDQNCYPIDTTYYVKNKNPDGYLLLFLNILLERSNLPSLKDPSAVPGLNRDNVHSLISFFPKLPEQQKIADCLSSIDELISAEARKLDALRAYKKGLMQQLFPTEGETVPRLRFPEFRDAGEWKKERAGNLFLNRSEKGRSELPIYSVTINDGLVPRSSLDRRIDDITKPSANKKVYKGDIVYNMMRMWQGALGVAPEDCMVSPAYIVLKPKEGVISDFYGHLLKLPGSLRLLAANSRGLTEDRLRLYYDDFAKINFLSPSLFEQKRVSEFLSSLDEMAAIQSQKVHVLRCHKKGLMQQLFPIMDEMPE